MTALTHKQLAQSRPGDTNAVSAYSPGTRISTRISKIFVANTTGTAATFRLFLDVNGTTYDETTALYYDHSVAANDTLIIPEGGGDLDIWMVDSSGNLAVRTGTLSALTFTVYGEEHAR